MILDGVKFFSQKQEFGKICVEEDRLHDVTVVEQKIVLQRLLADPVTCAAAMWQVRR